MKVRQAIKNGRPAWLVDWRSAGVRHRHWFPSESDARRFARARADDIAAYGAALDSLTALERARLVDAWHRARGAGVDLAAAVDAAIARREQDARPPCPTVAAAVVAMMDAKRAVGLRARSLEQLGWQLKRFTAEFEREPVDAIRPEDIEAWLSRQSTWNAATRLSALTNVRTLFNWAMKRGWIERNPVAAVDRPKLEDRPPCILTVSDARRLLVTARERVPAVLGYLAIGLFAGLRPVEIDRLRWDEVQPDRGFVEVKAHKSKTRRRRLAHVEPVLAAWLALCDRGGDFVRPVNFDRLWGDLKRWSGVSWGHDIVRHSFASYHLAAFRDPGRTALELGHASQAMLFAHYRELVTPEDAAAWWRMMPTETG